MYAVVELQGHQYIVQKGDEIQVPFIDMEGKKTMDCEQVLCVFNESGEVVHLGFPYVPSAKVNLVFKSELLGEKIDVVKFKRKNRYERHYGHRSKYVILQIKDIKLND